MTSTELRTLTLALLTAALPSYAAYDSAIGKWEAADLPAFNVATLGSSASPEGRGRWRVREQLIIEVATKSVGTDTPAAEATLAALLDALERTVVTTLEQSSAWLATWTPKSRATAKGRDASGEYRWGQLLVRYELEAIDVVAADGTAVPLEAIHARLDLLTASGKPDGTPETEIRVTDLQETP